MGFFQDLKEDLSSSVNELIPQDGEELVGGDGGFGGADDDLAEIEAMLMENELEGAKKPAAKAVSEVRHEPGERKLDMNAFLSSKPYSDEVSTITAGMTVNGDITSQGALDLIGCVHGNISISGKLSVTGIIEGNSQASEIYADSAKITGEVRSSGSVKVGQETVIVGNIFATNAVIAGAVKGDIDVQGSVVLDTTAIVMGNIKSKAVQINKGAVVEGMCSQCYADVNPVTFFDEIKKAEG